VRVVMGGLGAVAVSAPSVGSTEESPARAASDLTLGEAVGCADWDGPAWAFVFVTA
jgi:hypothetical protein